MYGSQDGTIIAGGRTLSQKHIARLCETATTLPRPRVLPKRVARSQRVVPGHVTVNKDRTAAHELVDRLVCENPFNVRTRQLSLPRRCCFISVDVSLCAWMKPSLQCQAA
uniref:Uncharacterized protein n=1 Tax=Anguilla anguilla TaxID=7936 RepID=A0A0E9W514_ANGAN